MVGNVEHIGRLGERSLHAALKQWYAQPGDHLEERHGGYVIDITRSDDELIEIQTGNFSALRKKLLALADDHIITVVHPIAETKWIVRLDADTGEVLTRRRSPKRGRLVNLFDQLVYAWDALDHPNVSLEVVLTREDEIRCDDGKGSWRRKRVSIIDHQLLDVLDVVHLETTADLVALIPDDLKEPFTTQELAKALKLRTRLAQRMSYCLRKTGALEVVGKRGRSMLMQRAIHLDASDAEG